MATPVMDGTNTSLVTEFVLLGLTSSHELQLTFFVIFSAFYLAIVLGNLLVILAVASDPHLHSPMYFLLANLSFIDVCQASFATPKMIVDFLSEPKTISYNGCITQIFFVHLFTGSEQVFLVAMAYDRYVAICQPLHYMAIMSWRKCVGLSVTSWVIGFIHSSSQLAFTVNLPFCGPNVVDSFFCDLPRVTQLACVDTYVLGLFIIADAGLISTSCFVLLLASYTVILATVWRRQSSTSMAKARATLSAHITVVILFFGPCVFIYLWPFTTYPVDKVLAVFYTVATPILNPIIYTLRNKDMKAALKKLSSHHLSSKGSQGSLGRKTFPL